MRRIFIAGTRQNEGKTTVALGLILNVKERIKRVGFLKPIGQRYIEEEGVIVSKDSFLIEKVCGFRIPLRDMNPIIIGKGFTEKYINSPFKEQITTKILDAYNRISKGRRLVIVEGTGHAGVGSVFDHSNAYVASILGCKAILVSSGGLGRPVDEIMLNYNLFKSMNVEVLGVIVNKVLPEKISKIKSLLGKCFSRLGVKLLGVLPYHPELLALSVSQILEETDYRLVSGESFINRRIDNVLVGAVTAHDMVSMVRDGSLIVAPGDRDDIILAVLNSENIGIHIAGLILTQDIMPHFRILSLLKRANFPTLISKEDTFTVANQIRDINVKIRPQDKDKIEVIKDIVGDFIDIDFIIGG